MSDLALNLALGFGVALTLQNITLCFLGCLVGLGAMAAAIGENDEAERIALFLAQLDPSGGAH